MEKRGRVLLVDDEIEFVAELQAKLETRGHKVVTACNRIQVQEMACDAKPDLIIVGTMAPRGDAFLLQQWLKNTPRFSDLPIIVVDSTPEKQSARSSE